MSESTVEEHKIQSSYSALTTHRRCPQQYFYKYDLRLDADENEVAPERDFGSWWAILRAAENLERGRKLGSLKQDPNTQIKLPDGTKVAANVLTMDTVFEAAHHWWHGHKTQADGQGAFADELWQEKLGGEAPTLLKNLLERHTERWAEDIKHEHPLGVEVFWNKKLPIPNNDPWQTEYPEMNLIGFIDLIYWDDARGMVVARDDKTHKQLDAATSAEDMMDSQLHLYAWGANNMVKLWTGGKSIQAVSYDRARSIAPKPPMLTKSGKLRVVKGEPSVSSTDLQTYLDWVATKPEFEGLKKDGSGAGVYEAEEKVIEKLKSQGERDRWFQRTLTPLNRNLIQSHLRAAVDSSVDAYRTRFRASERREAQRNLSKACSWCDFATLCRAQMIGGARGTYDLEEYGLIGKDGGDMLDGGRLVEKDYTPGQLSNEFDL